MPLFHSCPVLLQVGSIIAPGNFGRILRLYKAQNANVLLFRETTLENIRQKEFPTKPSRLSSTFALETLEEATFFQTQVLKNFNVVYEVEWTDPGANKHRGDYNKVGPGPDAPLLSAMPDVARAYWNGANVERAEVVSESALRILRVVDIIAPVPTSPAPVTFSGPITITLKP